jgi:hypothetical protein
MVSCDLCMFSDMAYYQGITQKLVHMIIVTISCTFLFLFFFYILSSISVSRFFFCVFHLLGLYPDQTFF